MPGLVGLLASDLRHHSTANISTHFGQQQLKLILAGDCRALLSVNAANSQIDVVVCGSSKIVADQQPIILEAVLDVLARQRAEQGNIVVSDLCSECWKEAAYSGWPSIFCFVLNLFLVVRYS